MRFVPFGIPAACLVLMLAGCGAGREEAKGAAQVVPTIPPEAVIDGAELWAAVEPKLGFLRTGEPPFVDVQVNPAPYRPGEPEEDATWPLTFDGAAKNLLGRLKEARPIAEGGLTWEDMRELKPVARRIVKHADEMVTAISGELTEEDESVRAKWLELVALVELNAKRLWLGAATRSSERVAGAWHALLEACVDVPQLKPGVEALRLEKRAKRAEEAPAPAPARPEEPEQEK